MAPTRGGRLHNPVGHLELRVLLAETFDHLADGGEPWLGTLLGCRPRGDGGRWPLLALRRCAASLRAREAAPALTPTSAPGARSELALVMRAASRVAAVSQWGATDGTSARGSGTEFLTPASPHVVSMAVQAAEGNTPCPVIQLRDHGQLRGRPRRRPRVSSARPGQHRPRPDHRRALNLLPLRLRFREWRERRSVRPGAGPRTCASSAPSRNLPCCTSAGCRSCSRRGRRSCSRSIAAPWSRLGSSAARGPHAPPATAGP